MFIYYRGLLVGAKIIILMDNGQWIMDNFIHYPIHCPLSIKESRLVLPGSKYWSALRKE